MTNLLLRMGRNGDQLIGATSQRLTQCSQRVEQTRLHRAQRTLHHLGNLFAYDNRSLNRSTRACRWPSGNPGHLAPQPGAPIRPLPAAFRPQGSSRRLPLHGSKARAASAAAAACRRRSRRSRFNRTPVEPSVRKPLAAGIGTRSLACQHKKRLLSQVVGVPRVAGEHEHWPDGSGQNARGSRHCRRRRETRANPLLTS